MPDNRSIVITLKLDNSGSDEGISKQVNTNSTSSENDKGSSAKAVAAFAAVQAIEAATSELVAWGEYYWNKELTLNDDYIGQRNKNVAISQINAVASALGTIGSTTATGAMIGGPWGALAGAIIGTGVAAAKIIRSNKQGSEQQEIAIRQMNAQLEFTRSRAGWSLNAGSIGEDL